jgi:hypothetical protein
MTMLLDIGEFKPRGRGRPKKRDEHGRELCTMCGNPRDREGDIGAAIDAFRKDQIAWLHTEAIKAGMPELIPVIERVLSSFQSPAGPTQNHETH